MDALAKGFASGAGGGGGGGGGEKAPGSTVSPTSATAVSPTIQTQVSPQISPIFQQSQGGGSQTASTSMISPGGQSGSGGSAGAGGAGGSAPGGGFGMPYTAPPPTTPLTDWSTFDASKFGVSKPVIQQSGPSTTTMVLLGVAAVAALALGAGAWAGFGPRRRRS